jgi:hypothetical protein
MQIDELVKLMIAIGSKLHEMPESEQMLLRSSLEQFLLEKVQWNPPQNSTRQ